MRSLVVCGLLALLAFVPSASASSLSDDMKDFHFADVTFTVGWDTKNDRGQVVLEADGLAFVGEAARDLRKCIDGDDCPVPELHLAASGARTDGQVSSDEVSSFTDSLRVGILTTNEYKAFAKNAKGIVKIDGTAATSIALSELRLKGAEGDTTSSAPITLDVALTAVYGLVQSAKLHDVWVQRAEANLTVADSIVVQAGKHWRIVEESVRPTTMQAFYSKGKLAGTQHDFESPTPLTFQIEYHKSLPGVAWLGALVALATAALVRRKA